MNKQLLFELAVNHTRVGITITDPEQHDNPIIFANDGFYDITGYSEEEVIGENCRFLQGNSTDKKDIDRLRTAIEEEKAIELELYNYKKDGTGFWNELTIDPVWVEDEQKTYFIGIQKDITNLLEKTDSLEKAYVEIEKLSTPFVPVTDNAVILPLIGDFSDTRFNNMYKKLSHYMETAKENYIIIDLSGLYEMDTYAVSHFLKINYLAHLMGKKAVLTGIGPNLALKTAGIINTKEKILTFANVRTAIEYIAVQDSE